MKKKIRSLFSLNPWPIIIIGFLLTIAFSITLYRGVEREKKTTFEAQVDWALMLVENRIEHYEGVLIDARSHLLTTPFNRVTSFIDYIKGMSLMDRYPGIQGLGLALMVKQEEVPELEKKMQKIYPDFRVWPEVGRDTRYPIVALLPFNRMNKRALGFDMGSEAKRRQAMEEAARTKKAILSGKIFLVQEDGRSPQPGFNLYLPVFFDGSDTPYGFVYNPFRAEDVFSEILSRASPHITVEIFDGETADQDALLYRSSDLTHGRYESTKKISFGGRELLLRFRDHETLNAGYSYISVWLTSALGIFISVALFFLSLGAQREIALVREQLESASNLRLRDEIIDRSLNGFDIVNDEGKFSYVNPAYVRMWGYESADEILGTSPAAHCADPSVPGRIIDDLRTKGKCDIEFTALRKDGSTFEVRMLSFLAHDNEGREIYPSTSVDISSHKNALRTRDEFLSLASHELKTPLTSLNLQVQTFERLLKSHPEKAQDLKRQEKFVTQAHSQVLRLARLIDDMLDVSRISTGKLSLRREVFNLRDLVRDIIERMIPQFEAMKLDVPVVPEGEELTGNWDKLRIDQAIMNLLTNALKYGNRSPVFIEMGRKNHCIFISVIDKGQGIPEEAQKRVFERYERAGASSDISGLGLGLFLTRQIVEGHGGEIRLESSSGSGSRFTILLPPDQEQAGDIPIV